MDVTLIMKQRESTKEEKELEIREKYKRIEQIAKYALIGAIMKGSSNAAKDSINEASNLIHIIDKMIKDDLSKC